MNVLKIRRLAGVPAILALAVSLSGCIHPVRMPTPAEREPDKYLFDRGTEALQKKRWLDARLYFERIVDAYPQSPYRQAARLGIGDSQLGEASYASYILAAETFREFLRFYPLNERADYAQYRLAMTQYRQMLSADRDQTATHDTLRELAVFMKMYPNSPHMPEALNLQRLARSRLSDSELNVGIHYFRHRWYPGAIPRLQGVIKDDPAYLKRDAAYYYLGESYYRVGRRAEALPYFDKLLEEFKVSDYLERAKLRSEELRR
jgi:outer membrane protein assembly factor BamD